MNITSIGGLIFIYPNAKCSYIHQKVPYIHDYKAYIYDYKAYIHDYEAYSHVYKPCGAKKSGLRTGLGRRKSFQVQLQVCSRA